MIPKRYPRFCKVSNVSNASANGFSSSEGHGVFFRPKYLIASEFPSRPCFASSILLLSKAAKGISVFLIISLALWSYASISFTSVDPISKKIHLTSKRIPPKSAVFNILSQREKTYNSRHGGLCCACCCMFMTATLCRPCFHAFPARRALRKASRMIFLACMACSGVAGATPSSG